VDRRTPGTKEGSRAPGGLFFRGFLLAEQKKWTQGAGAEPPAIMRLSAGEARSTKSKAAHQAAFDFIRRVTAKNA